MAKGPQFTIVTWQGYDINGYTFYTAAQDRKSTVQNSGVRIDAFSTDGLRSSYYGQIEEIWELDYVLFKIPLFRCRWVHLPQVKVDNPSFSMKNYVALLICRVRYIEYLNNLVSEYEWFVFVSDTFEVHGSDAVPVDLHLWEMDPTAPK